MTQASRNLQQINFDDTTVETKVGVKLPKRRPTFVHQFASNWVPCALLFSIALSFNLYRLGAPSIWFDEAFSVELARQPLPLLWHIIFNLEPNMELYYLFLHGWLAITALFGFHPTEFVVRLPSAIFSASGTVVVFLLGRRFLGLLAGLIGATLYLLNDLQLVYAQQARSTSLQLLLICLSYYAFLSALTGASYQKRWWIFFTITTMLAVYAHLFSLIILFAQLCAFSALLLLPTPWRENAKRQTLSLLISLIVMGVLLVPLLPAILQGPKTGWLPIPHISDISHLFLSISDNNKTYLFILFVSCLIGLLAPISPYLVKLSRRWCRMTAMAQLRKRRPLRFPLPQHLPAALVLLCWLVVPIVVSYLVSHGNTRLFSPRYLVTIVPPLLLLVGLGLASIRWFPARLALALCLCLLALYVVPQYYRSAQVEDWNSASSWLERHYQTGDGPICYDNAVQQGCQISIEYYLHAYPTAAHFTKDAPGAFSWSTFSSINPDAAVDTAILATYGAKHPRIFFIVGRLPNNISAKRAQLAQNWLDTHYQLLDQIVTPTVTIRLYITS